MQSDPSVVAQPSIIPLSAPEIRGREWEYVKECLDGGWVSSSGPFVDRFEREFASYLGCPYTVATSSGTAALHTALLVAGIEPDDEVLVSTLTFIAPANAIRYVGAWPVFVDAEPVYWQMDTERVERFLAGCRFQGGVLQNPATGRRVRGLLPVHILGHPCDMGPIMEQARHYDLTIIEDASESLGARYRGAPVGCLGDIACFSFNGNKVITTGGGGMIATAREEWAERARYLTTQAKDDPVEYVHRAIGFNYRLTNVQAAIGCAQLEQLDQYIEAKRVIAARYRTALTELAGFSVLGEADEVRSTFWLSTVRIDPSVAGMDSRAVLRSLRDADIESRPLWQPIHQSSAHADAQPAAAPIAERLYRECLSLPSSVGLTAADQDRVIEQVFATQHAGSRAR